MNAKQGPIRSILFDLGSTLWGHGSETAIERSLREGEASASAMVQSLLVSGAATLAADIDVNVVSNPDWAHELRERVDHTIETAVHANHEFEPDYPQLHLAALRSLGIHTDDTRWGAMLYEALRARSSHTRALYPDALSTLAALRQRGYILGVVTNRAYGGPIFIDDLQQIGLLEYFAIDHIAISSDLRFRKPHPMIYRYALAGVGTEPGQTAMVGNNLTADVMGARRLGIYSIWKRERGSTEIPDDANMPDATITDLAELLDIF